MKTPIPPPQYEDLAAAALAQPNWLHDIERLTLDDGQYHPWEWYFRHDPPAGLTSESWWFAIRLGRRLSARPIPLTLVSGTPISYNLPNSLLQLLEDIQKRAQQILTFDRFGTRAGFQRQRYLLNSLVEEAISSSQLDGAKTARRVAQEMLREGRKPKTPSEWMIFHNFEAMQWISKHKHRELTPDFLRDLHHLVTGDASPVPVESARLIRICDFANQSNGANFMPPLLRALTLHFMLGHEHHFSAGNGRIARAVFYWSMLHQGLSFAEYLPLSRTLKKAPAAYARSFLHAEQDGGDLTYFFLRQAKALRRALLEQERYLQEKAGRLIELQDLLSQAALNIRQIAVLETALMDPIAEFTVVGHSLVHRITKQTARTDLQELTAQGWLREFKRGRAKVWVTAPSFDRRIRQLGPQR